MQNQEQEQEVEAPPRSRRRGARSVELIFLATISYAILLLLFRWGSIAQNYSYIVNVPREFDNPGKTDTKIVPPLPTFDLEQNLRALQELTSGKHQSNADNDDGNVSNSCPPPLKLYKNRIVSHNHTTNTATTTKIPQILHLSERSRCLNRDMYDAIQIWQESFPSFSIFFHDDAAVDRLLYSKEPEYSDWRSEFPDIVNILPCVAPGAMKIDIWRVLILWKYGGIYSDADVVPNPDMLTESAIHPDSEWFSLADAWDRTSQWFFAASAHHMTTKNALHIIAQRVLDVENVQKTKLVYVTGPESLYSGWKDSIRNETEKINQTSELDSISAPPAADQVNGTIITFKDGSWGHWIGDGEDQGKWINHSYWNEKVPFEETKCISRKKRSQKHFGRVHWSTAKLTGEFGLPQTSCREHLENLQPKIMEQGKQQETPSPSNDNETVLPAKSITDLILKNTNNSTMCAYLENEFLRKVEELRSDITYCGDCHWFGGRMNLITCDARLYHMIEEYELSPEEAFNHVMERAACKRST